MPSPARLPSLPRATAGAASVPATAVAALLLGGCGGEETLAPEQRVAGVSVSPPSAALEESGASRSFTASAVDSTGRPVDGVSFRWSSTDPAVAAVDAEGRATARGHGTTGVVAAAAGHADTARLQVTLSGALRVSAATSGPDPDPDGYEVAVDAGPADSLASDGSLLLSGLSVGEHRVELSGVASNCDVQGENPRSATVEPADTTSTAFEVECSRRSGAVRVEAPTSGAELDADGYVVEADTTVDDTAASGSPPVRDTVAADGSVLLDGLPEGGAEVRLSGLAANCRLTGDSAVRVQVAFRDTAEARFGATCLGIVTDSLRGAVEGASFTDTLAAAGGTSPYDWEVASGALPDGLSLSSVGVISGTPTSDDAAASFRVAGDGGLAAERELILAVNLRPDVTVRSPEDGDVFAEGDTIGFRGSAGDPEGTDVDRLEWFRSPGGDPDSSSLGTGGSIDRADLPTGEHEVWLVAEADDGLVGVNPRVSIEVGDASAGYQLEIRGRNSPPARVLREARAAAARWERIVTGAEEEVTLDEAAQDCHPAVDEVIDDAVAYVRVDSIDGPGNTLAQAGPRFLRSESETTILGCVEVDEADLQDALSTDGALQMVLEHELAHVLGFPALWNGENTDRDLLTGSGTSDPRFTGARAASAYDSVGGSSSSSVPLEPGDEAHWPENEFGDELLTPALRIGAESPLSAVTAATFGDMEMTVDVGAADDFTLGGSSDVAADRPREPGRILRLGHDLLPGVVRVVDRKGRVIRVFRVPPRRPGGRP